EQFCSFAAGNCGSGVNPTGQCVAPPMDCKGQPYLPVCGCDEKTYDNACEVAKVGVSIQSSGPCPCGGPNGLTCPMGQYCAMTPTTCLMPNATGTCQPVPQASS